MESKMNKVWIVVVGILFCWSFVVGSASTPPLTAIQEVTLDVRSKDSHDYQLFISQLRYSLRGTVDPRTTITVLPVKVAAKKEDRYVLAKLKFGDAKSSIVTIPLDVINAYVLGFIVDKQGIFFNDVASDIYDNAKKVFGLDNIDKLTYGGRYIDLERTASRETTPLGNESLKNAVIQLYKYVKESKRDIVSNLLQIVQMLSEAARFKYIEKKLNATYGNSYTPKPDVLTLENNWGTLSGAIQTADKQGKFKAIQLKDENGKPYDVSQLSQVKDMMGLLLAKENVKSLREMIWPYSLDLIN